LNKNNLQELLEFKQFIHDTVKLLILARPSEFFTYHNNYCNLTNDKYIDLKKRLDIIKNIDHFSEFHSAANKIVELMIPLNLIFKKMYFVQENKLNEVTEYYYLLKSSFKILNSLFIGLTDQAINEVLLSFK
jgi:hypothetical protein